MALYEIRVRGHLARERSAWFDGLTVTSTAEGDTILAGLIEDEAALHGILMKVRDLHLPLLSVQRLEAENDPQTPGVQREGNQQAAR